MWNNSIVYSDLADVARYDENQIKNSKQHKPHWKRGKSFLNIADCWQGFNGHHALIDKGTIDTVSVQTSEWTIGYYKKSLGLQVASACRKIQSLQESLCAIPFWGKAICPPFTVRL